MPVMKELEKVTYVIEYSPNCPMKYLVRLVAPGTGCIDKLPPDLTRDALGYGRTLEEAAMEAFRKVEDLKKKDWGWLPVVQPG